MKICFQFVQISSYIFGCQLFFFFTSLGCLSSSMLFNLFRINLILFYVILVDLKFCYCLRCPPFSFLCQLVKNDCSYTVIQICFMPFVFWLIGFSYISIINMNIEIFYVYILNNSIIPLINTTFKHHAVPLISITCVSPGY